MGYNAKTVKSKAYRNSIFYILVMSIILFLSAHSLMYWEAWVYIIGYFAFAIFCTNYILKNNPELIAKRMQVNLGERDDKQKVAILLSLPLAGLLISGFDHYYHWSIVSTPLIIISIALVSFGHILMFLASKENTYLHSTVHVEQKQKVVATGPYAIVRHPMYTGWLLTFLFTPLALDSYWALIPFLSCIPILISRILREEELLLRNLSGYEDYCLKTSYRLIPSVW